MTDCNKYNICRPTIKLNLSRTKKTPNQYPNTTKNNNNLYLLAALNCRQILSCVCFSELQNVSFLRYCAVFTLVA